MAFEVVYCNERIHSFLHKLEPALSQKAFELIEDLAINGNRLDLLHTKTRCEHIFKIRVKSPRHSLRVFYTFIDTHLYILHAYIKKDQRTRNKELDLAVKRLRSI